MQGERPLLCRVPRTEQALEAGGWWMVQSGNVGQQLTAVNNRPLPTTHDLPATHNLQAY